MKFALLSPLNHMALKTSRAFPRDLRSQALCHEIPFRTRSMAVQNDPFACDNDVSSSSGVPPSLVIEAISDYYAQEVTQLSFQTGEFFHVTDVHTDSEGCPWFQAENPIRSIRGLVPSSHFRQYGPSRPTKLIVIKKPHEPHSIPQLRHAWAKVAHPKLTNVFVRDKEPSKSELSGGRSSHESSKPKFRRSLYGIIQYSFQAERPDELTAYAGESVIVIAHSAKEWFVIKPIGRLGGPGFIPASYVELQEIDTCRVLSSEQVAELIRTSTLPTVEDWKKHVASYKASSIPLGALGNTGFKNKLPEGESNRATRSDALNANHLMSSDDQNSRVADWRQRQATFIESAQNDEVLSLVEEEEEDEIKVKDQIAKRFGILRKINVTSFHYEQGQFWYQVHAHFRSSKVSDRQRALVLYRIDDHFRTLRNDLLMEFPSDINSLPLLPDSPPPPDEMACAQRMEQLRDYFEAISASSESIRMSIAVCEFLSHRQGDMDLHYSDDEADLSPINCTQNSKTPALLLPPQSSEPYSIENTSELNQSHLCAEGMDQELGDARLTNESILSDDVRSWLTSCEAASPHAYDFSVEGPAYSTGPSSIRSRSSLPLTESCNLSNPSQKLNSKLCDSPSGLNESCKVDPESNGYIRITLNRSSMNKAYEIRVPLTVSLLQLLELISDQLASTYDGTIRFKTELSRNPPTLGCDSRESPSKNECPESFTTIHSDAELHNWLNSGHRFMLYLD